MKERTIKKKVTKTGQKVPVFLYNFYFTFQNKIGGKNMNKFTQKDLAYITDMFGWNENALKIANDFLEKEKNSNNSNSEVVSILEAVVGMHYENLQRCICILNGQDYTSCYEEMDEEEYQDEEEQINE